MMKIIITEEQKSKIFQIKEGRVKTSDRVKLYEDERILVVIPLTHNASCKYGANTPWCVSVPSTDVHFNEYSDNGILFYFIIKSPYEYGDIKEYKFVYYHPINDVMKEYSGWYDMSDYQYGDDDEKETSDIPDIRLINFLIPKKIMELVFNYIKNQVPLYKKKFLDKKKKIFNMVIDDPYNVKIHEDDDWVIMYRDYNFGTDYQSINYFPTVDKDLSLFVIYGNKKNYNIYRQFIPFYIDIRTYRHVEERIPSITDISDFDDKPEINKIFMKYFKKIALQFFINRKKYYYPRDNDYMYMYPDYVEIGDIYNVGRNDTTKIIAKEKLIGSYKPYKFDVQYPSGQITKDIYYNETLGVGLKYDKEKHNPKKI